jgi:hypothetical protein
LLWVVGEGIEFFRDDGRGDGFFRVGKRCHDEVQNFFRGLPSLFFLPSRASPSRVVVCKLYTCNGYVFCLFKFYHYFMQSI